VANHRVCANGFPLGASIHGTLTIGGPHYVLRVLWLVLVEYGEWGSGTAFVAGSNFGLFSQWHLFLCFVNSKASPARWVP